MAPIARFEAWVRGVVEGRLGTWLGARLQPVDIARQLAAFMDGHLTVGSASRYAPNSFRVYLAPRVMAGFSGYRQALADELAAGAVAHAQASGYRFLGRVRVALLADERLPAHRVRVEADVVDRDAMTGGDLGVTTPLAVPPAAPAPDAGPPAAQLVGAHGRRALPRADGDVLRIGRALDNDVILSNASVSRHHARLTARGGAWLVEDLGSRHGTVVNGRRVERALLRPGDELVVGAERLRIEVEPR